MQKHEVTMVLDFELPLPGYNLFWPDRPFEIGWCDVLFCNRSEMNAMEHMPEIDFPEQVLSELSGVTALFVLQLIFLVITFMQI